MSRSTRTWALLLTCGILMAGASSPVQAAIIVNDSWADAGRDNGADAQDTDWWTSSSSQAIEVSAGSLGLVTGSSGRGIHGTFTPQALAVGQTLKATFTFKTPATVGSNGSAAFRIGMFNSNGNNLAQDLSASSGSPNPIYNTVQGYMLDYDVNASTNNIGFRERNAGAGQLLATTSDYTTLASGGNSYTLSPNTTYTGTMEIARTASGLDLTGSLSSGSTQLSTFTTSDPSPAATTFDVLGFHANSNMFGSTNAVGAADNGLDFSNVTLVTVPEPTAAMLAVIGLLLGSNARRLGCRGPAA